MISRLNKLILVLVVVALALYVVILNPDPFTIKLYPGSAISSYAGVILLGAFFLGVITSTLGAIVFGVRAWIREKRLLHQERSRMNFFQTIVEARGFIASGEWGKARDLWERFIRRENPEVVDVVARVELARALEGSGERLEALRVLDAARASHPENIEVLFTAAQLNLALGNKTATLDNLALILYQRPNRRAAEMARELSEELGRFEDALEYHKMLSKLDGQREGDTRAFIARIDYKILLRNFGGEASPLKTHLYGYVKSHPNYAPALEKLAHLEESDGKIDEAAELYVRAAKASQSPVYWRECAKLWLRHKKPDRAIAAAKTARNETAGALKLNCELDLIRLYISLHMYEEAKRALETLQSSLQPNTDPSIVHAVFVLQGIALSQLGEAVRSSEVWKKLSEYEPNLDLGNKNSRSVPEPPSPLLSTP